MTRANFIKVSVVGMLSCFARLCSTSPAPSKTVWNTVDFESRFIEMPTLIEIDFDKA